MFKRNPDVLIAGAGPVGMFAALALTQRGVSVEIADRGWRAGTHSFALALHPQSLGLLHDIGLLDRVMQKAYPVRQIGLYDDASRKASIRIEGFPDSWSCLAVVRQDDLEDMLELALRDRGVHIHWSHEVFGLETGNDGVAVRVDKFEKESGGYSVARTEWVLAKSLDINAHFVIGADGHRSRVRRALKLDYDEISPAQHYAVFEFETDAELGDEVRIVMGDRTTDVLWPLPDHYCRWSFEMPDYHQPAERLKDRMFGTSPSADFPALTVEHLREFLAERAPWFKGSIGEITWRNAVRFERRMASGFGAGRMWLAGDAAHLTGPAGVQSMNVGLCEARDLSETITRVVHEGGSMSDFDSYQSQWSREWRRLLGLSASVVSTGADAWVAARASRIVPCLPAYGEELPKMLNQVGLAFAESATA